MFNQTTTRKQQIRNPELHIGKYVRHYANWDDFNTYETYFVCEWTGKLTRMSDDAYYGDYFETIEEAWAAGYNECYSYCHEGLMQMAKRAKALAALNYRRNGKKS